MRVPGPSFPRRRPNRGSVILFVLGVILLTAFLLTQLIARAGSELLVESRAARLSELRAEAYSALEVTLAVLADFRAVDDGLHAPQQGWSDPLAYAGYQPGAGLTVAVRFDDETGKLPLAAADAATLERYAETIGLERMEAERLADALLAWTKADHVASFAENDPLRYEMGDLPYAAPQRPLRSFEELRAVAVAQDLFFEPDGRWSELGERFREDASLHRFSQVNLNTARPSVLVALGLSPAQAVAIAESLAPVPGTPVKYFRTAGDAATAEGLDLTGVNVGTDVRCLRVRIAVRRGGVPFLLEAVVRIGGGGGGSTPRVEEGAVPSEPRPATRKRVDYPFGILELRESHQPLT
ncbi:MAG TPA: hypothetical protein VEB66_05820 [Opitutaceae bacterium]|nr:hypothetical protein [Opitutaceae bacterium]